MPKTSPDILAMVDKHSLCHCSDSCESFFENVLFFHILGLERIHCRLGLERNGRLHRTARTVVVSSKLLLAISFSYGKYYLFSKFCQISKLSVTWLCLSQFMVSQIIHTLQNPTDVPNWGQSHLSEVIQTVKFVCIYIWLSLEASLPPLFCDGLVFAARRTRTQINIFITGRKWLQKNLYN